MRHGRTRSANRANAGIARRGLGDGHRVQRRAERSAQLAQRGAVCVRGRPREAPITDHHDGFRALAGFLRERVQRSAEIGLVGQLAGARMRERIGHDQWAQGIASKAA